MFPGQSGKNRPGDLGIADNTIVIYTTDNGPHLNEWPDAAITPFRGDKKSKVHLDGYNLLLHITGQEATSPRQEFFYFSDDGVLTGLRLGRWKLVFAVQRARQMAVWREPFAELRLPLIFDLCMDPYKRAELDSNVYNDWHTQHQFLALAALPAVSKFVRTFDTYPAREVPGSFSVEHITAQRPTRAAR